MSSFDHSSNKGHPNAHSDRVLDQNVITPYIGYLENHPNKVGLKNPQYPNGDRFYYPHEFTDTSLHTGHNYHGTRRYDVTNHPKEYNSIETTKPEIMYEHNQYKNPSEHNKLDMLFSYDYRGGTKKNVELNRGYNLGTKILKVTREEIRNHFDEHDRINKKPEHGESGRITRKDMMKHRDQNYENYDHLRRVDNILAPRQWYQNTRRVLKEGPNNFHRQKVMNKVHSVGYKNPRIRYQRHKNNHQNNLERHHNEMISNHHQSPHYGFKGDNQKFSSPSSRIYSEQPPIKSSNGFPRMFSLQNPSMIRVGKWNSPPVLDKLLQVKSFIYIGAF